MHCLLDEVICVIVTVTLNASIDKAYYLDSPVVDGTVHTLLFSQVDIWINCDDALKI